MTHYWQVTPEWQGETVFIVAGGTSVEAQNTELLRGRRVIVVNSSYERVPFADILFFGDDRWFVEHKYRSDFERFKGRIVTTHRTSQTDDGRVLRLKKITPLPGIGPGLTLNRSALVCQRTSLQGAMNLAVHLGAARIVLLGADMARAPDGRTHHHKPHKWKNRSGNATWDIQMAQLRFIVAPLAELGVDVINTSLASRIPWWPKRAFDESLLADDAAGTLKVEMESASLPPLQGVPPCPVLPSEAAPSPTHARLPRQPARVQLIRTRVKHLHFRRVQRSL